MFSPTLLLFSMVNVKLSGDLKEAYNQSMQSKSLEHRLKLALQNESLAKERISELEFSVKSKDKELQDFKESAEELQNLRAEEYEYGLRSAAENLKSVQDHLKSVSSDLETSTASYQEMAENLKNEIDRLNRRLNETSSNYTSSEDKIQALTSELRASKNDLKDRDLQNQLLQDTYNSLEKTFKLKETDLLQEINILKKSRYDSDSKIITYEANLQQLKEVQKKLIYYNVLYSL